MSGPGCQQCSSNQRRRSLEATEVSIIGTRRKELQTKHTAGLVRAAGLLDLGVEAVHVLIDGRAGDISGTACISASSSLTTGALGGLVPIGLAATDTEHLVNRHLHERLVGLEILGANTSSQSDHRHGGDRLEKHLESL